MRLTALTACARSAVRSSWAYRADVVALTVGLLLQVWLLSVV